MSMIEHKIFNIHVKACRSKLSIDITYIDIAK